jgi:putative ABC transport system ATP-binding protein
MRLFPLQNPGPDTDQPFSPGREAVVNLHDVSKNYAGPAGSFAALRQVDLQVPAGEFVAVVGKSGSGKSTLLNMLSGIDRPSSGTVLVAGTAIHTLTQDALAGWRGQTIGLVFQFFQLLPTLTVVENVMLPMDFANTYPVRERKARALQLLERVGVVQQAYKLPGLLSGGEQQRAAIARALANNPPVLLADEPTGNLDSQTADSTLQLFRDLARSGKTVIMVTHERDVTTWVDRTVRLADGRIIADAFTRPAVSVDAPQEAAHV